MRILVIGGSQFIGRILVTELLKDGHEVAVLHRKPRSLFGKKVQNLVADRNDAEALQRAVSGIRFQAVFDNAYDMERGTTGQQVEATARVFGSQVDRYVFTSSVAAYGDGLNHVEDDPLAPDTHAYPYMRNKAMSERALFRLHQATGFPVVTFRPPYVYGPFNPLYREAFFWDRIRRGRPILVAGDGTRLMQFVYVHDLVAAMVRSLAVPAAVGQAFNIGHPKSVTQLEFVRELAKTADKKPSVVHVPRERITEAAARLGGDKIYFGEMMDLPPITEKIGKVQRVLGTRPCAFAAGLAETYRWYLRQPRRKPDFELEELVLGAATTTL